MFTIAVKNKHCHRLDKRKAVCSNTDYKVKFLFDEEWNTYPVKTLQINYGRNTENIVFEGDTVHLPMIEKPCHAEIGVYAGNLHTTTPAVIEYIRSITSSAGTPPAPRADAYSQIMDLLNGLQVSVESTKIEGGHRLTIKDTTGEHFFDVMDGEGESKPYTSLERVANYLYKITFDTLPELPEELELSIGGCSSYVKNGKLHRNLDWDYAETAEFIVKTKKFTGMSYINSMNDGELDRDKLAKLPYQMADGVNESGIMVAAHVLFNDWEYAGNGNKNVNILNIPFLILENITSLDNFSNEMSGWLSNLYIPEALAQMGYLLHFIVTDGRTTYVIEPPESSIGSYAVIDATENPKLANFRWVNRAEVDRTDNDIQTRPTGIERWNAMPCNMADIRFTSAYELPNRLSEFIGLRDTTKDSTDAELTEIYNVAKQLYLSRERDGQTWQTMHSVVYSPRGMEELYVQENFSANLVPGLPDASRLEDGTTLISVDGEWTAQQGYPYRIPGDTLGVYDTRNTEMERVTGGIFTVVKISNSIPDTLEEIQLSMADAEYKFGLNDTITSVLRLIDSRLSPGGAPDGAFQAVYHSDDFPDVYFAIWFIPEDTFIPDTNTPLSRGMWFCESAAFEEGIPEEPDYFRIRFKTRDTVNKIDGDYLPLMVVRFMPIPNVDFAHQADKTYAEIDEAMTNGIPVIGIAYGNYGFSTVYNCTRVTDWDEETQSETSRLLFASFRKHEEFGREFYEDHIVMEQGSDGRVSGVTGVFQLLPGYSLEPGNILRVSEDGNWVQAPPELPEVSNDDNGKILKVVNGEWAAVMPE